MMNSENNSYDFNVYRNHLTLKSYYKGYDFGEKYFSSVSHTHGEILLNDVLRSVSIPHSLDREAYLVGIVESFLIVRFKHLKKDVNMLTLYRIELTNERNKIMGQIKAISELAAKETQRPFLITKVLVKMNMHFCIKHISIAQGMNDTKQWAMDVTVDPDVIEKYNIFLGKLADGGALEKEGLEKKLLGEKGEGRITVSQGNDKRDFVFRSLLKDLPVHNAMLKGTPMKNKKLFIELDEHEGDCVCEKYKKALASLPDDFDPFLDDDPNEGDTTEEELLDNFLGE